MIAFLMQSILYWTFIIKWSSTTSNADQFQKEQFMSKNYIIYESRFSTYFNLYRNYAFLHFLSAMMVILSFCPLISLRWIGWSCPSCCCASWRWGCMQWSGWWRNCMKSVSEHAKIPVLSFHHERAGILAARLSDYSSISPSILNGSFLSTFPI